MKTLYLLLFLLIPAISFAQAGTEPFEGRILLNLQSDKIKARGDKTAMVFLVKGDRIAFDVKDASSDLTKNGAKVIFDRKSRLYYTLVDKDGQRLAMTFHADSLASLLASAGLSQQQPLSNKQLKMSRSNDVKTVNGFESRKYNIKGELWSGEAWVTQNFPVELSDFLSLLKFSPLWNDFARHQQGQIVQLNAKDQKTGQQTVFSISAEKRKIDDKQVDVPKEYQVVEMSQMLSRFKDANPEIYKQMLQQFVF